MHWLGIGSLWLLSSTVAWTGMLGIQLWRHPEGLPDRVITSAYLGELCLLFSLMASTPLLLLHLARVEFDRRGLRSRTWTALLVVLLAAWPALDQAAFLTSGDGIAGSGYDYPVRVAIASAVLVAALLLWDWHLRGLTPRPVGKLLSRFPRWSRRVAWLLAGVGALSALGNTLHFHLSAYAHLAGMLLWPTWLLLATIVFRAVRPLRLSAWVSALLLVALGAHIGAAHFYQPEALSRTRHEVLRRGKTASHAELLINVRAQDAVTFDLSHPEHFDCARPQPPPTVHLVPTPPAKRRNIILISVDALRRDAIDWTYANEPLMPNLQAFAREALDFRQAVTIYPATLMALGGAVTGGSASDILFSPRPVDNVFERTAARFDKRFVVLPSSPWFDLPVVDKLLVQTAHASRHAGARAQTSAMIGKLHRARAAKQSTFAWVHYFEPHGPYELHRGYERGHGERGHYRSELSFLDHELGRLLRALEREGWYEDSLVIVFADHGEALGEQQYFGHHVYLNSWNTDIPLMLRAPQLPAGVSTQIADITDIAPTVLDFAQVPYGPDELAGLSLFAAPALREGRLSFAEAFPLRGSDLFREATRGVDDLETLRQRVDAAQKRALNYLPKVSVVSANHRLIVNRVTGVEELYDRRADPWELTNLSHQELPVQRRLRAELHAWTQRQAERLYCAVAQKPPARGALGVSPSHLAPGATEPTPVPDAATIAPHAPRRILGKPTKGNPSEHKPAQVRDLLRPR